MERVVVIGAGFAGLGAARELAGRPVEVTSSIHATITSSNRCCPRSPPPPSALRTSPTRCVGYSNPLAT